MVRSPGGGQGRSCERNSKTRPPTDCTGSGTSLTYGRGRFVGMRIEKDQLIAGLPAIDVRRFMRRAAGYIIRPRTVTHVLGFCEDDARQLLRRFQKEGLVTANSDYWEATAKGHAHAMATAASPLRRITAERLITEVVERARMIKQHWVRLPRTAACGLWKCCGRG